MGKLDGKTVFITGASSGIGEALARRCAAEGATLALTARRAEKLEALAAELRAEGARALALSADVTRDGDLEQAVTRTREAFGGLDVVVANAGFGVMGNLDRLGLDDYRRQFETNVFGVIRTVQATLPELRRSRGCLTLVGSVAAYVATPTTSAYSMSKAAVASLAQALRGELAPDGVGVVLITPGFVESEIRLIDNQGKLHEDRRDFIPGWVQMPAAKAAAEIVDAIVHRERERVITGHGKAAVALQRHAPGVVAGVLKLGTKLTQR